MNGPVPSAFKIASLALLALAAGCAGLPPLTTLSPLERTPRLEALCKRPFLNGEVRLIHALTPVLAGHEESTAIAVLAADPERKRFRSVLMTLEGLVLFDIESAEGVQVHRAVPPFAGPAFAQGMAEDIAFAFFAPADEPSVLGEGEGGSLVCRYHRPQGETVDVVIATDGAAEVRLYGAGQEPRKRVRIPRLDGPGLAGKLEIQGLGWPGYGLKLRLIEAEQNGAGQLGKDKIIH
ncbi:MAG: hypothetical protein FWE89_03380 [Syntrophaceae bacterium]|nr:hypothetical protein [Syntrophaceae bacterium]